MNNEDTTNNSVQNTTSSTAANDDKNAIQMISYLKNISNNVNGLISLIEKQPDDNTNNSTIINEISKISSSVATSNEEIENNNQHTTETNKENTTDKLNIDANLLAALPKENTLVISYTDSKVVLPFTIAELNEIQKENTDKYSNIIDVFDDLYLKDIKYYKNTSIARFRETFKLVREREHGSLKDAILLSLEVFTNYNVYPAIISACKNVNELDVYLSCLEYNELEDFHFFNIDFVIPPVESTAKNELISKLQGLFKPKKNMRKCKH